MHFVTAFFLLLGMHMRIRNDAKDFLNSKSYLKHPKMVCQKPKFIQMIEFELAKGKKKEIIMQKSLPSIVYTIKK